MFGTDQQRSPKGDKEPAQVRNGAWSQRRRLVFAHLSLLGPLHGLLSGADRLSVAVQP